MTKIVIATVTTALLLGGALASAIFMREDIPRAQPPVLSSIDGLLDGLEPIPIPPEVVLPPRQFGEMKRNAPAAAESVQQRALDDWEPLMRRAETAFDQGDWNGVGKALDEIDQLGERGLTRRGYELYLRGRVDIAIGDTGSAITHLSQSLNAFIASDPNGGAVLRAMVLRELAMVYSLKGEPEGTEYYLRLALASLERSPESVAAPLIKALGDLAVFFVQQKRPSDSLPLVQRADTLLRVASADAVPELERLLQAVVAALPLPQQQAIESRREAERQYKEWIDAASARP